MSTTYNKGVPGIPLSALDAIQDENTRQVLKAMVDGWHVRNGSAGQGDSAFVTKGELASATGHKLIGGVGNAFPSQLVGAGRAAGTPMSASQIDRIITDLQASVMESVLFKELGDRIKLIQITANGAATGLSTEITNRTNADNAIVSSVTTQFATVNGNLAALQTQQTTTANNVSALSTTVTTLQASVGANTTAISTEATARVNADNNIYSKYSVKIDTNGYVTGFGLISTANNATPYSDFLVRSDRFSIASPSGPGITPAVPFIVLTTTDSKGNTPGVYMDNAMIKNAAIGTAKIDDASVNTLKIAGESVFVTRYSDGFFSSQTLTPTPFDVITLTLPITGLAAGETAPIVVIGFINYSPSDGSGASFYTDIHVDGSLISPIFGVSVFGNATFGGNSGTVNLPNGTHVIKLRAYTGGTGVTSKNVGINALLTAQTGKR